MGTCFSSDPVSQKIDAEIKRSKKNTTKEVKMLLLGPGESGKSTVFKQMKIIQDRGGFDRDELSTFISIVHANCISQMKVLLEACHKLEIEIKGKEAKIAAHKFFDIPEDSFNELAGLIKILWSDAGIQTTFKKRGQHFQINDTASYFFEHIDRFTAADYLPTTSDVLRARVRSTGIEEAKFAFEDLQFLMVDVGGQRSERRKWIHLFSNVTAILFVAGLSGYSHSLREDPTQNTMAEALLLFDEVANAEYFTPQTPKDHEIHLILFLNKTDLFQDALLETPLSNCFPEYRGANDFEPCVDFIKNKFKERAPREVYIHNTCALDTKNVQYVITLIRATLLKSILSDMGTSF